MLRHLKRVYVQFTPGDPRSVSARDLLQRLSGDRAKKSNPQCKVDFKIDEDAAPGSAFVELTFGDDELRKIALANTSVQEVSRLIEQKGSEMELKAVLKEVKVDPWKKENRLDGTKATPIAGQDRQGLPHGLPNS